ncbi:hypothetical protein J6590_071411 [Homalodisca vitripennis]|nr:hypothetical protein J6590_071411 [Homalodisca vitripennis]
MVDVLESEKEYEWTKSLETSTSFTARGGFLCPVIERLISLYLRDVAVRISHRQAKVVMKR